MDDMKKVNPSTLLRVDTERRLDAVERVKKLKKEKILHYTVIFEPAEEGGYVVTVPKLFGLTTEGDTFEEAKRMAKDAIHGYVESLMSASKEVPVEKDRDVISLRIDIPAPAYPHYDVV